MSAASLKSANAVGRRRVGELLAACLSALVALVCYLTVLRIGVPKDLDLKPKAFLLPVAGLCGVFLLLAFSRSDRIAQAAARTLTLILFALPLGALWQSGRSDGSQIGGLLPFSDADGYFHCARALVEGHTFRDSAYAGFCSRRPLFTTALAGLLALTGQDLRATLALLVLITAATCLLAAGELRRSHGAAGATLFLLTLFLFYRRLAGTTLTEHLGLAMGAVAFAGLWRAARIRDPAMSLFGLFLLTLALNARAGAFLILPAVVLWSALRFRGISRLSWRHLGLAAGAVLLGFGLNAMVVRALGSPAGAFSNFPYSLYGLVFGGDYKLALKDHPELAALEELEQSQRVLVLALGRIRAAPESLAGGSFRAWRAFFLTRYPFRYVLDEGLNLLLRILAVLGVAWCFLRRGEGMPSLLLASAVGLLLSIPFAPPWDADVRIYAATLPFQAALPALGGALLLSRLPIRALAVSGDDRRVSSAPLLVFGWGLVALAFVPPLAMTIAAHPPRFAGRALPDCNDAMYVRAPVGSMIRVVGDDAEKRYPFELRQSEFRQGLRSFRVDYPGFGGELASVKAPFIMFNALGLQPLQHAFVVAGSGLVTDSAREAAFWRICTEPARDAMARAYGLRYATSIQGLSPTSGR